MTRFKTCINKKMCSPYIVVKSMQIVFLSNRAIQRTAFSSKYVNTRFLNKKNLLGSLMLIHAVRCSLNAAQTLDDHEASHAISISSIKTII